MSCQILALAFIYKMPATSDRKQATCWKHCQFAPDLLSESCIVAQAKPATYDFFCILIFYINICVVNMNIHSLTPILSDATLWFLSQTIVIFLKCYLFFLYLDYLCIVIESNSIFGFPVSIIQKLIQNHGSLEVLYAGNHIQLQEQLPILSTV